MGSIFRLTVQQLSGKWRLVIMAVLSSLPPLFTWLVVHSARTPDVDEFEIVVIAGMLAGAIAPLIVVAIASVAFSNEIEDRTLANLTLAPLPRWKILVPKLLGSVTVAGPFVIASSFITSFVAFNHDMTATWAVTVSSAVGLLMYSSMFVWIGLMTKQAIGVSLLYVVLWEGFFSGYVSGIRFFSIRHYAAAFMHGIDPRRFTWSEHVSFGVAVTMAIVVIGGFMFLSTRRLRVMDVP